MFNRLGRKLKKLFCCKQNNPQWLAHLLYECTTRRRTSDWCSIILESYHYLTNYEEQVVKRILQRYKQNHYVDELINDIRNDINKPNVIHSTIGLFSSYVRMRYADTINPTQITINRIKNDFEEFTQVLKDCIILYYNLDKLEELFQAETFNRRTLMNLSIELIFDNDNFYETISQLQRKVDREANDKIQFNMQKFEQLRPMDYGISVEFCLDETTLQKLSIKAQVSCRPYDTSIEYVRQIVKVRYPQEKLKKVQTVISSIEESIDSFYKKYKVSHETLNADSLISILVYIIIQSKQANLASHLKIITNYINRHDLNSGLGYSLASIEACLHFIEKCNIKRSSGVKVSETELSLWLSLQNYFEQITNIDL